MSRDFGLKYMMLIYADTNVCAWNLQQIQANYTTDFNEFTDSPTKEKSALFHIPYPYEDVGPEFEKRIDIALNNCNNVAVLCSELHQITVDFILRYKDTNIKFFACGFIDGVETTPWMDWFNTSTHFYKTSKINPLNKLTPHMPKNKIFDVLLGMPRPHRNLIYNYINKYNFQDRVVMTYRINNDKILPKENNSSWIWEDTGLATIDSAIDWTVSPINYFGFGMSLSQVVPINIYNQTAYSIVAETNAFNHFNFYTEKIVKPIIAKRLFVVFAGYNYLKNLRSFGFKTFDGIIDESYDSVSDSTRRFSLALQVVQQLLETPQEQVLEQIKPIVEHNAQLMLSKPWYDEFSNELKLFLAT